MLKFLPRLLLLLGTLVLCRARTFNNPTLGRDGDLILDASDPKLSNSQGATTTEMTNPVVANFDKTLQELIETRKSAPTLPEVSFISATDAFTKSITALVELLKGGIIAAAKEGRF